MNAPAARFALQLDLRQARLVAEALAELPYAQVRALMAQLEACAAGEGMAALLLDRQALALVVRALGELPYRRVHALVGSLERQLAALGQGQDGARRAA